MYETFLCIGRHLVQYKEKQLRPVCATLHHHVCELVRHLTAHPFVCCNTPLSPARLLGVFANLRKPATSFVVSVRMEQLGSPLDGFS
jgi:hypothetical protein